MATVTFDTLEFVERLKGAGIPEEQAKVLAEAFKEAQGAAELMTKKDLQIELVPLKSDLTLVKWVLGLVLGGGLVLIPKTFFPG